MHEGASKGGLWRRDSLLSEFSTLNSESDFSTLNSEDSYAPWGLFQAECHFQGLIPWPFPEIKLFKEKYDICNGDGAAPPPLSPLHPHPAPLPHDSHFPPVLRVGKIVLQTINWKSCTLYIVQPSVMSCNSQPLANNGGRLTYPKFDLLIPSINSRKFFSNSADVNVQQASLPALPGDSSSRSPFTQSLKHA